MNNKTKEELSLHFAIGLILMCLIWMIDTYLKIPTVFITYPEKECIRIESPDNTEHTCSNLPPKYEVIYVRQ